MAIINRAILLKPESLSHVPSTLHKTTLLSTWLLINELSDYSVLLYVSKLRIHSLQIIALLLLLFWRSHCESPRAYTQSPARNVEGDGSRSSLATGGNPKQGDLNKHIYLLCSCVSLPHLTLSGAMWRPTCLLLFWCTLSK